MNLILIYYENIFNEFVTQNSGSNL